MAQSVKGLGRRRFWQGEGVQLHRDPAVAHLDAAQGKPNQFLPLVRRETLVNPAELTKSLSHHSRRDATFIEMSEGTIGIGQTPFQVGAPLGEPSKLLREERPAGLLVERRHGFANFPTDIPGLGRQQQYHW